jgi:O-antigen/teichoic acid export membrane protein
MSKSISNFSNLENLFVVLFSLQALQFVFSFLITPITSRMITPEQCGSWGKMIFLFNIYGIFTDLGLEVAASGHEDSDETQSHKNFSSILFVRVFLSIVPVCLAIFATSFFGKNLIFFLFYSIFFLFDKVSNLLKIWFDKNFEQQKASQLELSAFLSSNLIASSACYFGFLQELLPLQKITEKIALFLFFFREKSQLNLSPKVNVNYIFTLIKKFAIPGFGGTMASLLIYDFLPFVLSVRLGNAEAGLFIRAFSLATLPMLVTTIFNRITTPLYAKSYLNPKSCRSIFLLSQITKALLIWPIILFLQNTSQVWIGILCGSRWIPIVPIYKILCVYVIFRAHYDDLGSLINIGISRPGLMAKNQMLHASLILLFLPSIIYFKSIIFASAVFSLCMFLVCINLWVNIFIILDITLEDIFTTLLILKKRGQSFVIKAKNYFIS